MEVGMNRLSEKLLDDAGEQSSSSSRVRDRAFFLRNFRLFSAIASTNHALNYVVNSFSFALLSPFLGAVTLGLNWTLNSVSGLFVSTPVVKRLGFKRAIIISFWGYTVQILSLFLAVEFPEYAWPFGLIGAIIAGFTSAIWWTAQGVCFDLSCAKMQSASEALLIDDKSYIDRPMSRGENLILSGKNGMDSHRNYDSGGQNMLSREEALNQIRANLSAEWTLIYQGADIVIFLGTGLLPLYCDITVDFVMFILAIVGVITSLMGEIMDDLGDQGGGEQSWKQLYRSVLAVPKQFSNDLRPNFLAPFVFGFGITTAMFYSFFNNEVISDSLGVEYIGLFECFSYFVACVAAYPYAYISNKFTNGQHYVMQFGSVSFGLCGLAVAIFNMDELSVWTTMLGVKGLYGLGRGVFEGSCRAVYAEVFGKGGDEDALSTAFSGQTLLAGISGGIVYFLSFDVLTKDSVAAITIINSIIAFVLYAIMMSYGENMFKPIPWPCCSSQSSKDNQHNKNGYKDGFENDDGCFSA